MSVEVSNLATRYAVRPGGGYWPRVHEFPAIRFPRRVFRLGCYYAPDGATAAPVGDTVRVMLLPDGVTIAGPQNPAVGVRPDLLIAGAELAPSTLGTFHGYAELCPVRPYYWPAGYRLAVAYTALLNADLATRIEYVTDDE